MIETRDVGSVISSARLCKIGVNMTGADRSNMSLSHYNGLTSPAARNEEKITAHNCPVRQ